MIAQLAGILLFAQNREKRHNRSVGSLGKKDIICSTSIIYIASVQGSNILYISTFSTSPWNA